MAESIVIKEKGSRLFTALLGIIPVVVLILILQVYLGTGFTPLASPGGTPPVIEDLDIERIEVRREGLQITVLNSGPKESVISHVFVNDAIWNAEILPSSTVQRLQRATILVPYHEWVPGEPLEVTLLTETGIRFSKGLDVAWLTPSLSAGTLWTLALTGAVVGIVPVFLGLGWLPFIRRLGRGSFGFLLAATLGLAILLGVESFSEALEHSSQTPEVFRGSALAVIGFLVTFLGIEALGESNLLGRRDGKKTDLRSISYMLAIGIGVHNMGEGLGIGAAYAIGSLALGTLLVVGFTVQNITEGLAIVSPISRSGASTGLLVKLGLIAGLPTIMGSWIGGLAFSPLLATLFLAVGAGAIIQVAYEIAVYLSDGGSLVSALSRPVILAGVTTGLLIMYLTGLLVV